MCLFLVGVKGKGANSQVLTRGGEAWITRKRLRGNDDREPEQEDKPFWKYAGPKTNRTPTSRGILVDRHMSGGAE